MGSGSMRLRGRDSWELRVYQGVDPDSGRQRWMTKTVHGTHRFASRQLEDLVEEAGHARIHAGTYLNPHLGHLDITKLTTADIGDFYGHLLGAGGRNERPLAPGAVARALV
jgi:hypothetical protein